MDNQRLSLGVICFAVLFITSFSATDFLIRQVTNTEYNNSTSLNTNLGVTSVLSDMRPSSKIVTIANFSVIKERYEPYQSSVFEALGYKWRLVLYVKGNSNDGGANHISLYVKMEETDNLPSGWEVNIDLRLFVQNKRLNKYLIVSAVGATKRFTSTKKEWGFGQLIPLSTFYDTNEGYIVEDTCSFGAEIVKPVEQEEKVTFISNPPDNVFTWKILHFSTLENKFYYSDEFLVGDRYWKLGFNPKGYGHQALPLFLYAQGFKPNAVATTTWGEAYLRLKNQLNSNHRQLTYQPTNIELSGKINWAMSLQEYMAESDSQIRQNADCFLVASAAWYPISSGTGVGVNNIILFTDLFNATKGYLLSDSIILEVEMIKVSLAKMIPIY